MQNTKWKLLQLFADGGDGGPSGGDGGANASATGDTGVDAGHKRLLELGVPADKLRKRAKGAEVSLPEGAVRTEHQVKQEAQKPQQQAAAAEETPTEEKEQKPVEKRLTWDEIKADPEYSKEMQSMVQARLKNVKQAQDDLATLTPALEIMARAYGMDPDKLDYAALAQKVQTDNKLYEKRALELGVSAEAARKMDQFDLMQARQQREQAQTLQDKAMQQHYGKLLQQGEILKQKYPGFDLQQELKNPAFVRLTAPNVGISVEDAYYTVHRKEIEQAALQVTAQQTAQQISNAIQSGTKRPDENGTASHAPSVTSFDYRKASKEQRNELKRRIREAGARGEKLYPGR